MEQKPPESTDTQQAPQHTGDTPAGAPQPGMDHASDSQSSPAPEHAQESHQESHEAPKPEEHHAEAPVPAAASPVGEQQLSSPSPLGVSTPPGGVVPPGTPNQPHDPHAHKSNAMLFAVVTLVIVLIGAVLVTIMSTSNGEQPAETAVQPTEVSTITEAPTQVPSPSVSTPEEEVEAVNITEDNADLQEVEQDLQNL